MAIQVRTLLELSMEKAKIGNDFARFGNLAYSSSKMHGSPPRVKILVVDNENGKILFNTQNVGGKKTIDVTVNGNYVEVPVHENGLAVYDHHKPFGSNPKIVVNYATENWDK